MESGHPLLPLRSTSVQSSDPCSILLIKRSGLLGKRCKLQGARTGPEVEPISSIAHHQCWETRGGAGTGGHYNCMAAHARPSMVISELIDGPAVRTEERRGAGGAAHSTLGLPVLVKFRPQASFGWVRLTRARSRTLRIRSRDPKAQHSFWQRSAAWP